MYYKAFPFFFSFFCSNVSDAKFSRFARRQFHTLIQRPIVGYRRTLKSRWTGRRRPWDYDTPHDSICYDISSAVSVVHAPRRAGTGLELAECCFETGGTSLSRCVGTSASESTGNPRRGGQVMRNFP